VRIIIIKVIILSYDMGGVAAIISYKVVDKLRKAGAVSRDKAMTPSTANLDFQETEWLQYLACDASTIKKTRDGLYYI
jgi:hypothetical protein